MSDWPRRASPAAKTPCTLVANLPNSAFAFERSSVATPSAFTSCSSGPRKPIASSTSCAGQTFSLPGTSTSFGRPSAPFSHFTCTVCSSFRLPWASPTNRFVLIE
jgi:hypothetical protein